MLATKMVESTIRALAQAQTTARCMQVSTALERLLWLIAAPMALVLASCLLLEWLVVAMCLRQRLLRPKCIFQFKLMDLLNAFMASLAILPCEYLVRE